MKKLNRILIPLLLSAPLVVPLGSSLVASHFGVGKARGAQVAVPNAVKAPLSGLTARPSRTADPEPLEEPEGRGDPEPAPGPESGLKPAPGKGAEMGKGMDLLGEGTRMILRGLLSEVQPLLEDLRGKIDDLNAYHPPEVLPNGDILIRRRIAPDGPPALPGTPTGPNGEVEL